MTDQEREHCRQVIVTIDREERDDRMLVAAFVMGVVIAAMVILVNGCIPRQGGLDVDADIGGQHQTAQAGSPEDQRVQQTGAQSRQQNLGIDAGDTNTAEARTESGTTIQTVEQVPWKIAVVLIGVIGLVGFLCLSLLAHTSWVNLLSHRREMVRLSGNDAT